MIAVALAFFLFRPFVQSAQITPHSSAKKAAVEMPELLKLIVGERNFGAPKDAATATPDEAQTLREKGDIPAVTGLKRLEKKSDSIKLAWDEVSRVSGYRIYWKNLNDEKAEYKLFSTTRRPGLEIRNLTPGALYGFKVSAFVSGENADEGEPAELISATIPTQASGLRVTKQTKSETSLAWDKNELADGYLLERCYQGKWSEYKTFDRETTEFTDSDFKGGKAVYYRLKTFREDSDGKLYGESDLVRTVAGLVGPKDNGSKSMLGRISLDYKKSDYADGYQIYYSKDKEEWEQLTETTKTHFGTARLDDGETYYFRIYPYKKVDDREITGWYSGMEFVAKQEIYGEKVGETYVEVSVKDQHMWYIVDGDVYLHSDCVTGNYGSADTPEGFWRVNDKISPCTLEGEGYVSYVTYWMPFIGGGWGLHDATWRSKFGGSIYKGDGSHGCVNLPFETAKKLYAHIEIGTPVIIY